MQAEVEEALGGLPRAEEVAERVERVLADELYWFPVRHHSPTVAHYLQRAIAERRPRVIFLEGPSEAQDLLAHVVAKETRPPVAIYSSFRDDLGVLRRPSDAGGEEPAPEEPTKLASWYPLTAYSPEYVAMKSAAEVGADIVLMDLPHFAGVAAEVAERVDAPPAPDEDELTVSFASEEERFTASELYSRLARAAGYRAWDEAWDTLFETRGDDELEGFRRELATFCCAARLTTPARVERRLGTHPRERFMWATIERTLAERGLRRADAMVVCGGAHLFLDQHDDTPPPPVPEGTLHTTLVPYSFARIAQLTGYGAGNRAPQFYQRVWDGRRRGREGSDIIAEHAVHVLAAARRRGALLAAADAIAVVHQSGLLAQLRGRPEPVLDDLRDALVTCCVKGDPATEGDALKGAMLQVDIGTKLGKVTAEVGRLPIVLDYYRQIEHLELELFENEKLVRLKLDKRDTQDAGRSAFFHRLRYLGVPIGAVERDDDTFGQSLFREFWTLKWTPAIEDRLVTVSIDGDSVSAAAANRLGAKISATRGDAGDACEELLRAVDMDLTELARASLVGCGIAIDEDGRFSSLTRAFAALTLLERYGSYRGTLGGGVAPLLLRAFTRACFAMPEACAVPAEEHPAVVDALRVLAEAALQREDVDRAHFATYARSAADLSPMPYLRGAFLGILVELRDLAPADVALELSAFAHGPSEVQVGAGDFLHGVLSVSRMAIMLGADQLVTAIDEVLGAVDHETFLALAPRLRAAMAELHASQVDALAQQVAVLHGLVDCDLREELSTSVEAAALIAELDAEVAERMALWSFE